MNRNKLFYFLIFILFFVSTLFLVTCKKDPTSSDNNDLQTTVTIGSAGGSLETNDFSLQVPAGSFQNETTLSLSVSNETSVFGESSASQSFKVEGLPDEFDKPIRLAIRYNIELSDSSYIAIGKISYDYLSGDSSIVYHYISIKDSSGFLVGNLHGNIGKVVNKTANRTDNIVNPWTWMIAATGEWEYSTDNFNIHYRGIVSSINVQTFGNLLEEMKNNILNDLNYDYFLEEPGICRDRKNCWKWPIKIIIANISDNSIKMIFKYIHDKGGEKVWITVDDNLLGSPNSSETQENILKTLLALSFRTYDDYYDRHGAQDWFKIAVIDWLSSTYNQNNPGIPAMFLGNELEPFVSMRESFYSKGHGRVSLIKYLIDNEKIVRNDLRNIINSVHENTIHPIYGILNAVNGFVADWWPDFFEKLINSQIYNIDSSVFLNTENLGGTWNIISNDESETIFSNYPDLSAKRFIVNLNNTNFDENANLYLDATGNSGYDGVATIVFGVNSNSTLQHLVTAKNGPGMIPNLKQYYDSGTRKFLVVVVNSMHNSIDYWGNSDIELKMEVKIEENDYNYCSFQIFTIYDVHAEGTIAGAWDFSDDIPINWGFTGQMANGTFTGTASPTDEWGNTYNGSLEATIGATDVITNFSIQLSYTKYIENSQLYWGKNVKEVFNYELQGSGSIPNIGNGWYKIAGTSTCSNIIVNNYTRTTEISNPYSGTLEDTIIETSNGYSCNSGSYLDITFANY